MRGDLVYPIFMEFKDVNRIIFTSEGTYITCSYDSYMFTRVKTTATCYVLKKPDSKFKDCITVTYPSQKLVVWPKTAWENAGMAAGGLCQPNIL